MNRRGSSLIGILVAAVVLIVLFFVVLGMNPFGKGHEPTRADKKDTNVIAGSFARGNDAVCINNLRSCRQAIEVAKGAEGKPPASLDEMREVKSISKCPIGGEEYVYDPSTGVIRCPHPGHQKY